jgi:hypothetical protein
LSTYGIYGCMLVDFKAFLLGDTPCHDYNSGPFFKSNAK